MFFENISCRLPENVRNVYFGVNQRRRQGQIVEAEKNDKGGVIDREKQDE